MCPTICNFCSLISVVLFINLDCVGVGCQVWRHGSSDVCLLSNIMPLDSTLLVVEKEQYVFLIFVVST